MKVFVVLFVVATGVWFAGRTAAADEAPPFRLFLDRQPAIPNGLGMKFFYDRWEGRGRQGGWITIKPGEIVSRTKDDDQNYRILYEAENFVLTVVAHKVGAPWTGFDVFLLKPNFLEDLDPYDSSLIVWHCRDLQLMHNRETYNWSRERLLQAFAKRCGKGVRPAENYPFGGGGLGTSYGWSGPRFGRPGK
jgi:hypothetical protein